MKKKGFTLIELLAVIVVLAIIAVIAVPIILNIIEISRKNAAIDSTYGYVAAIEFNNAMVGISDKYNTKIKSGDTLETLNSIIKVKGERPSEIENLVILKDNVVSGTFCINKYSVIYSDSKAKVVGTCEKSNATITLSKTESNITYPNTDTFDIDTNSDGEIELNTSNNSLVSVSLSGKTVTITPKPLPNDTISETVFITIKTKETKKYNEATAEYRVTLGKGILNITSNGYNGDYDGNNHSITIETDEKVLYSENEKDYSETKPEYKNAGEYTVYYKIEKEGYNLITGNEKVIINKIDSVATLSSTNGTVELGKSISFLVNNSEGDITCSTNNSNIATCSVTNNNITVTGIGSGTTNITVNISESTNYKQTSKLYEVTVTAKKLNDVVKTGDYIKMTPTSTSYKTDSNKTGGSSTTINPSELNIWRVIRVNSDKTIDVISENLSSVRVVFNGLVGYQNYVGYLNLLAKQYENSKYTSGSRHMGYNGTQTEYITDISLLTSNTLPQSEATSSSNVTTITEKKGLGDMGYQTDVNLVKQVYGNLIAKQAGTQTEIEYYLASRTYEPSYFASITWYFYPRIAQRSQYSAIGGTNLYSHGVNGVNNFTNYDSALPIRPIVILKSGLTVTGSGTESDPYVLQ